MVLRRDFKNIVADLDMYGKPILLSFKGNDHFKTFVGGLMSIISQLIIGVYLFINLVPVVQN